MSLGSEIVSPSWVIENGRKITGSLPHAQKRLSAVWFGPGMAMVINCQCDKALVDKSEAEPLHGYRRGSCPVRQEDQRQ